MVRGPGRRLVTLSTDIGVAYAAQMKAVLLRSVAAGTVVDLAHDIPAHAVREAAFLVRAMAEGFPAGSVHVVVVDPGVGGRRAPIAIGCRDGSYLVGPDNGVLLPLAERLGRRKAVRLEPGRLGGPGRVGTTFDGRDVFAPAAAALATGVPLQHLGSPIEPLGLDLPAPLREPGGSRGEVVHVDHFGNLVTNVPTDWAPPPGSLVRVRLGRRPMRTLRRTASYEALGPGRAGVLGSSFGSLEVAVAEGRADRRFRVRSGAAVRFSWPVARPPRGRVNSTRPRRR